MIRITDQPIDVQELIAEVSNESNGGIVAFLGVVRRWNDSPNGSPREVYWLEYEAYREAAEEIMREIAQQIEEKWAITSIAIAHRIGHLEIGEAAVGIAVGAPHRVEAFDACEYAIDTLKATAPIWKKEAWERDHQTGQSWVENKAPL
ncbi:MAG: molybdenum cofactor biosynthesis protein MoaE [Chloroflexi bacterium]|nr:molybdenum cofactor biosynthesis protein MoaE [Chloroflexota bacterium]